MNEFTMNYQKVYMNQIYSSSLMGQVAQMWRDDLLCDAVIKTGKIQTKAHRLVMIAACPMLQHMDNASLGSHLEVRLSPEIKKDSVITFLQYLYEGFMMLTEENCKDIEKIGKLLHVDGVVKCCKDFFKCLSAKIGSSAPSKTTFDNSDHPDFNHVKATVMQKMVQEAVQKRAGSDLLRENSPLAKRKRTHGSVTPPHLRGVDNMQDDSNDASGGLHERKDSLEVVSTDLTSRDEEGWPVQSDTPPIKRCTMSIAVSGRSTGEKELRVVNVSNSDSVSTAMRTHTSPQISSEGSTNTNEHNERISSISPAAPLSTKAAATLSHFKPFAAGSASQTNSTNFPNNMQGWTSFHDDRDDSLHQRSNVVASERTKFDAMGSSISTDSTSAVHDPGIQPAANLTMVKIEHNITEFEDSMNCRGRTQISSNKDEGDDDLGDWSQDYSVTEGDTSDNSSWQDNAYQPEPKNSSGWELLDDDEQTVASTFSGATPHSNFSSDVPLRPVSLLKVCDDARETKPSDSKSTKKSAKFHDLSLQSPSNKRCTALPSSIISTTSSNSDNTSQDEKCINTTSAKASSRAEPKIINVLRNIDNKLKLLSRRVNKVECTVLSDGKNLPDIEPEEIEIEIEESIPKNIPETYRLSMSQLLDINETTRKNPGNLALKLVIRFFPELFGSENQRLNYNWAGSGYKKELDPLRKRIIRHYVTCLYPDVKDDNIFKRSVVPSVNEGLRRPKDRFRSTSEKK